MTKAEYVQALKQKQILKSRRDFYTFLKFMSPPEFNWNWHHKYVCGILQDWILTDKYPFLMIFMPPQHQKSTMMTEYLPAWAFGQSIDYQALLVMYNSTMAKKYNRKIQRIMETDKYKLIFPETRLNEKNVVTTSKGAHTKNSEEFEIVGGRGFLKAVGVQGGIAGNPAKLAFMDDVIKNVAEGNSETYRNAVYDWYTDELEARLHNDSKVAFTITRRHDDDLAGRLILRDGKVEDGGKWKVVVLPALREDLEDPNDPRQIGEALFPELHSRARLEDIKLKNPRTFTGLYQQRPVAKGGDMIKGEWFVIKKPEELPFNMDDVRWDMFLDGAWTEKVLNDETAQAYTYFDKVNKLLYIRRVSAFRKRISKAIEYIKIDSRVAGCNYQSLFYVEMKSSGPAFYDFLREEGYNVTEINNDHVKLGKFTRAEGIETFLRGGKVILIDDGNWIPSFITQCEAFPNGKHDDKVDVLCYPIYEYLMDGGNPYILM
jgi:predicted phage terminase large subunit-like protein